MTTDYTKIFVWMNIAEKLLDNNQFANATNNDNNQLANATNNQKIFENLKVEDVILNNDKYPYFQNLLNSALPDAIHNPDQKYLIIYSGYIEQDDISKFLSYFEIEVNKVSKFYEDNLEKLFIRFQSDLNKAFKKKGLKCNIEFRSANLAMENVKKLFAQENNNDQVLCEKFNNNIDNHMKPFFVSNENNRDDNLRAYILDFMKIISLLQTTGNNLLIDFDNSLEGYNIIIPKDERNLPKFSLLDYISSSEKNSAYSYLTINERFKNYSSGLKDSKFYVLCKQKIFRICHAGLLYSSKNAKKLFLVFLDLEVSNLGIFYNNRNDIEFKLNILFSFLSDKNFKTTEKVVNYLNNISYDQLQTEFLKYYVSFRNTFHDNLYTDKDNRNVRKFFDVHCNPYSDKFHLKINGEIAVGSPGGSWSKNFDKNKVETKYDPLEQIADYQLPFSEQLSLNEENPITTIKSNKSMTLN